MDSSIGFETGLSDEDFASIMEGSTDVAASPPSTADETAIEAAGLDEQDAPEESTDDVETELEAEESDEPEAEPIVAQPSWDDDTNPYKAEALAARQAQERANAILAQQQQLQRQQAIKQAIEELPNADPDQVVAKAYGLIATAIQPVQEQLQHANGQIDYLGRTASSLVAAMQVALTPEQYEAVVNEARSLAVFTDPSQLDQAVATKKSLRAERDAELTGLRAKVAQLEKVVKAQGRVASGVDRVGGASASPPRPAPRTPEAYVEEYGENAFDHFFNNEVASPRR